MTTRLRGINRQETHLPKRYEQDSQERGGHRWHRFEVFQKPDAGGGCNLLILRSRNQRPAAFLNHLFSEQPAPFG
jgi:hypothetical protein